MQELRFIRTDGDYLIVENADGESFRLAIDDAIRQNLKHSAPKPAINNSISPREIQLEVRAGSGIAELAAKTGASVEYIEKFAAPVLDELAHVVQTALSVRITVAGDRYSDTVQVEFGELIAERLAANGFGKATWSSRKPENGEWQISCDLGDAIATWTFDLRKLALSPDNELAVQLSASGALADAPIPKLRPLGNTASVSVPAAFAQRTPEPEVDAKSPTADLGDTMEFEGVIPFGRTKPTTPVEPMMGENLANTADLLDALRKKRLEREAAQADTSEVTPTQEISLGDNEVTEAEAPQVAPEVPKPVKKGRAAVPRWDDIVFGTKTDSED